MTTETNPCPGEGFVLVNTGHHDGEWLPLAEVVFNAFGENISRHEAIRLDRGLYAGQYVLQTEAVPLYEGYCHTEDEVISVGGLSSRYGYATILESDRDEYEVEWCHHFEEWWTADDLLYGYVGRREMGYFHTDASYVEHEGNCYIRWNVAQEHGIYHCSECYEYFHEDSSCSCDEDSSCDDEGDREKSARYKALTRRYKAGDDAAFTVGVEVEKEDESAVEIGWQELYNRTGWCKEEDGSLDDDTGYELVSPTFDLNSDELFEEIGRDDELTQLVNGEYSNDCGGHIHLGRANTTGLQLACEQVLAWMPLFYALYPDRAAYHYSHAGSREQIMNNSGRWTKPALIILSNRVEIRIFPAVDDVACLRWRIELLRLITARRCATFEQVLRAIVASDELKAHLTAACGAEDLLTLLREATAWHNRLEGTSVRLPTDTGDYDPAQLSIHFA